MNPGVSENLTFVNPGVSENLTFVNPGVPHYPKKLDNVNCDLDDESVVKPAMRRAAVARRHGVYDEAVSLIYINFHPIYQRW